MARWDDFVQHYRLSLVVALDRPARLLLCVGCRIQVVLCSRCDRGSRYCSRACWRQTHDIARREAACRYQRSRCGRVRHAAIRPFKPLADFDWKWPTRCDRAIEELMTLTFMGDASNIVLVGPNGVGKTMCACNLSYQAVLTGRTALFITASQLLGELAALESDSALRRRLKHYTAPDLLMIDEVGYLSYSNRHADLLLELISRRYQHKSTVATTNKPLAEWGEVFPNAACVVSLIDRLMHRAEVVRIDGKWYRQKEADEREITRKAEHAARKTSPRSRKDAS